MLRNRHLVVSYKKAYIECRNTLEKPFISQTPSFGKKLTHTSQKVESLLKAAVLDQNSEAVEKWWLRELCIRQGFPSVPSVATWWRRVLMKTSAFITPLQLVAIRGNSDVAQLFIIAGADVDGVVNRHSGFDLMF